MLLSALKYEDYGWEVTGVFKMVSFLMGPRGGFTKCPCFLCLWDSRDTSALSQKGLATDDQVLCREEQRQVGAADRTSENVDPTTAHQVRPHQVISYCS